jgi:HK97 family phage prohead protease
MQSRAGRVLSGANENKLRAAVEALQEVLAQLGGAEDSARYARTTEAYTRNFAMSNVRVNRETTGAPPTITGYAAVFNSLSVDMGGWREQILPGAFGAGLGGDIRALWQHDSARVLGRTRNNTLQLSEDAKGLAFEITPPDTQDGRDALELLRRGDVDQMSFGFFVPAGGDSWESRDAAEGKQLLHTLKQVELVEVSVVTWPAYPATSAGVLRNAPEWVQRALQSNGDSHSDHDEARARLELEHELLALLEYTGGLR